MTRIYARAATALLFAALASAQRGAPIPRQLTFTPYHASGVYDTGETVGWTVTPGPVEPSYSYKWTIRRNNAVVLKQGILDLSPGSDRIEIKGDQPEMLYVAVEPAGPAGGAFTGGNTGRNNGLYAVGAAVSPGKIGLATPRPADFDAFWAGKLAAQAAMPIHPVLTKVEFDVPEVEMYTFVLDALGSHAQGYLAKPARTGKFPALIQLQYAGVYALNARGAAARAAEGWLVVNVDSHDKAPFEPTGNAPRNYAAVGNTDREQSYFLNMYLRDSRALDYLMTRPDWDGKTIVLMGTSMGGQQSLMLAGLRPEKITAVLVNVPAGADTNGDLHSRKAGYPNWPAGNPKIMETALYFDPVNFASHIQAPVLAAIGFIDTTSPPAGIFTALNQIPAPKEPLPMIESEHNNLTPQKELNWDARSKEVLDLLLRGEAYKPAPLASPDAATAAQFEVASIKPVQPNVPHTVGIKVFPGGRLVASTLPLKALIAAAFRVSFWQISGGEAWMTKDEFDIDARPPADAGIKDLRYTNFSIEDDQLRAMLQTLLIDRFQLKFHRESKPGDAYLLKQSGKPLQLHPSEVQPETNAPSTFGSIGYVGGAWGLLNTSMAQLAKFASDVHLHTPVLDQTGLTGLFDYRQRVPDLDPNYSDNSGSFLHMISDVGLKLEKTKAPVETFVIDSAAKPTPN